MSRRELSLNEVIHLAGIIRKNPSLNQEEQLSNALAPDSGEFVLNLAQGKLTILNLHTHDYIPHIVKTLEIRNISSACV